MKSLETYPGNISEKLLKLCVVFPKKVFGKSFRVTTYGHFSLKHLNLHNSKIWTLTNYIRYIKASFLVKNKFIDLHL